MTSFMLTISFILHVILIGTIYYLFIQISEIKKNHSHEMTQVFERYLNKIKEENIRLETKLDNSQATEPYDNKIELDDVQQQTSDHPNIHIESNDDRLETSIQANVLQLHNKGLSIEQIAKRLNCGKTEAELIINLYEQKNS